MLGAIIFSRPQRLLSFYLRSHLSYNVDQGPCTLIPEVLREAAKIVPDEEGDYRTEYCNLACGEDENYKFQEMCGCPTTTVLTTTPEPTTTPAPTTKPCVTSYLQQIACSNNFASLFGVKTCDCPLKEESLPNVCDRPTGDVTLCLSLQVFRLLDSTVQCFCPGPTTSPPPDPRVCYYSRARDDDGISRGKRINEGSPATFCDYPGIVGVFAKIGTSGQSSICSGVLVDESRILVSKDCQHLLEDGSSILVSSYNVNDVTTQYKLDVSKIEPVWDLANNALYFVGLRRNLTFDSQCVLPACLPNSRFTSSDVDFDNCRVVGYGMTTDSFSGPQSDKLLEVQVVVDTDSITSPDGLKIRRKDDSANSNVACYTDDSAPVMCAHRDTHEWIVVGLYTTPGFPCSSAAFVIPVVANILQDNPNINYFGTLSNTQYAKS